MVSRFQIPPVYPNRAVDHLLGLRTVEGIPSEPLAMLNSSTPYFQFIVMLMRVISLIPYMIDILAKLDKGNLKPTYYKI
jgi:hypothetical protein